LGPYDLEPNPSHVADKIISQLPHVQQEAINILGLVIPQNMKPSILAEEAKRLADSSNPNRKRLRRFVDGMKDELSDLPLVRQGRTFLDISDFRQRLSSAQLELSLPSLHLTNCALLALNIFLPSLGTDDKWQVIQELDSQFPACFMEQLADGTTAGIIGATELHQETFDLALSIRTQFFIMEVERRRDFRNFDPIAILRQIFCMDLIPGADDNDESPTSFRGFNLPGVLQDEDGHLPESLPERFQTAVFERFGDLRDEIYDDGVESLKRLYKLRFFERELVRWIQGRNKEIKEDLKHLTEDQGTRASPYRLASATAGPVNMRQGSVLLTPQKGLPIEPRTKESPQQSRSSQKIRTVDPTPLVQHEPEPEPEPEIQALRPTVTPQKPSAQVQVQITRTEPERRKSKRYVK
jgi:hypothetical protein